LTPTLVRPITRPGDLPPRAERTMTFSDAALTSAGVTAAPLPPRDERVRRLRALLGPADPAVRPLADGIRRTTHLHFERHVLPLVDAHWPALRSDRFFEKLRIGACDLYASAPYTAFFCAPRRPLLVRLVTGAGNALPLPTAALATLGGAAIEALGRFAYHDQHRRIILVAAFIVVVDHVFDHCMDGPPEARAAQLFALLDGAHAPGSLRSHASAASPSPAPLSPELALTRALATAMGADLDAADQVAFDAAMDRVRAWIRAEVRGMNGEPDPEGLGHRLAGVEGTIDGLLFPVIRFAGEGARRWMYDVSLFVQIADDWLDAEADRRSRRPTPVLRGDWTFASVEAAWGRTIKGIEALVRAAGLTSPRYVRFLRDAYVLMMTDVLEAMIERPDD
jgi:hypothetical protein